MLRLAASLEICFFCSGFKRSRAILFAFSKAWDPTNCRIRFSVSDHSWPAACNIRRMRSRGRRRRRRRRRTRRRNKDEKTEGGEESGRRIKEEVD